MEPDQVDVVFEEGQPDHAVLAPLAEVAVLVRCGRMELYGPKAVAELLVVASLVVERGVGPRVPLGPIGRLHVVVMMLVIDEEAPRFIRDRHVRVILAPHEFAVHQGVDQVHVLVPHAAVAREDNVFARE